MDRIRPSCRPPCRRAQRNIRLHRLLRLRLFCSWLHQILHHGLHRLSSNSRDARLPSRLLRSRSLSDLRCRIHFFILFLWFLFSIFQAQRRTPRFENSSGFFGFPFGLSLRFPRRLRFCFCFPGSFWFCFLLRFPLPLRPPAWWCPARRPAAGYPQPRCRPMEAQPSDVSVYGGLK